MHRILFAFCFLAVTTLPASAQKTTPVKKPVEKRVKVYYEPTEDSSFLVWHDSFKEDRFLETMGKVVNDVFRMDRQLTLSLRDCGVINAFYSSDRKELILCYQMLDYLYKNYVDSIPDPTELGEKIGNVLSFIYFHEIGHAMIDLLDIPLTGKEEDAADYFSFYFLASNEVPEGVKATMEGANFFLQNYQKMINDTAYLRLKKEGKEPQLPFWDEHSLDMQRFYTIAALIYGSNPEKYDYFIESGFFGWPPASDCNC
ncbi:MAG: hypothetical protein IPM85_15805 [Chitinophagaceae bacterium]|nr:hypothetical protein [Chitinophagaceae bacterium]